MRFSKWHALGNSYLLVERREAGTPLDSETAVRLCDVRYGIGSDGVLEVVPVRGTQAEIVIWNPDGSVAEFRKTAAGSPPAGWPGVPAPLR